MKSDLDRHIEKHLHNREFKIYFDRATAKRRISQEIVALRNARHITQAQLAKEIKTHQQVISRLENPADNRMPSLEFLDSKRMGSDLKIELLTPARIFAILCHGQKTTD